MHCNEDFELLKELKIKYSDFSSDELLYIWQENDRYSYKDEVFTTIGDILKQRKVELPQQNSIIDTKQPKITPAEKKEIFRGAACILSGIIVSLLWYMSGVDYVVVPTGLIMYGIFILIKYQAIK